MQTQYRDGHPDDVDPGDTGTPQRGIVPTPQQNGPRTAQQIVEFLIPPRPTLNDRRQAIEVLALTRQSERITVDRDVLECVLSQLGQSMLPGGAVSALVQHILSQPEITDDDVLRLRSQFARVKLLDLVAGRLMEAVAKDQRDDFAAMMHSLDHSKDN